MEKKHRSGFITIAGAPNVGKSTFLNRVLGEKVAITSPKPQTTRNRIRGIITTPGYQAIFVDTPGIHHAHSRLNRNLVRMALQAMDETDAVLLMTDTHREAKTQSEPVLAALASRRKPVVLAINKIDLVPKEDLLPLIDHYRKAMEFVAVVPICALTGDGLDPLLAEIPPLLPEGPELFPPDLHTDVTERFLAAEMVREKIFRLTAKEIPYATAVDIEEWREEEGLVRIHATILVERDSQKGIIIGEGGRMLKRIGSEARWDIEALLGVKVFLQLWVRVRKDWRGSPRALNELGLEPGKR
ncbi:MAG: GTPase Era [Pseudomonadota bacterium]